jgi:hypothetical protein
VAFEDSVPVEDSGEFVETEFGTLVASSSAAEPLARELEPVDLALAVEPPPAVVAEALTAFPENDWAATADSAPVAVMLPAISQRLMRVSLRSAASRDFMSSVFAIRSVWSASISGV